MANFNKAFNFRGGFQVDTDILVVRGQTVGIGSSVPTERLDVDGIVKAKGLIVDSTDSFFIETASVGVLSAVTAKAGIFTGTENTNGIATYYGDGSQLLNLPTSQWLDIDVGLGFTSIYAQGYVGVDTTDPRYVFQVGGVPFGAPIGTAIGPQQGVAIGNGNLYVSDAVIVGGGISAGIVTATQFVGMGSGITVLNADNLGVGSIGSMRYGNLIVTEQVIANEFIGTATNASGVSSDANLEFASAKVLRLEAVNKFISTTGYLQIGVDEDPSNVGDIEVFKRSLEDSTIYSISTAGSGRMYVGAEREGGSNIRLGGIRKGPSSLFPNSGLTDLDLVNLDTGNLNFYLHSGNSGTTSGNFRWLYGRTDEVLAEMSRGGELTLLGGGFATGPLLDIRGDITVQDDVVVGGGVSANGTSTFEDMIVNQSITVSGVSISTATVSDTVLVGDDPETGGLGTKITSEYSNISGIATFSRTNGVDIAGDLTAVNINGDLVGDVTAETISFVTGLSNANFSVDVSGDIIGNDATLNNQQVFNTLNSTNVIAGTATITDLTVTGSASLPSPLLISEVNTTDFSTVNAEVQNLTVTNSVSLPPFDYTGTNATIENLSVTSAATIQSLSATNQITTPSIQVDIITSSSPSLAIASPISTNDITTETLTINTGLDVSNGNSITIVYDDIDSVLEFIVSDANGFVGVATISVNTN